MMAGQRIAVPLWHLRYEQAREKIREITKAHPLTEVETDMLAEYAEQALSTKPRESRAESREYGIIVDWLHSTSRISPHERGQLLEVIKQEKR